MTEANGVASTSSTTRAVEPGAPRRRASSPSCARSPPATRSRARRCCRCCTSCRASRAGSPPEGIEACADILGISAAEVTGVATFYTMYKRRPVGDYHVGVCTNTLCAVMGGDADLRAAQGPPRRRQRRDHRRRQDHPRAPRVQRGLRLRPGDDGQLGVHGQHDPAVGDAAGRRPARRQGGPLHPRPAHLHLARGRAGARRLPRRPRRRGPGRRSRLAGRAADRPRERLDGARVRAAPAQKAAARRPRPRASAVPRRRPTPPARSPRRRSSSPAPRRAARTPAGRRRAPDDRHPDPGPHRQLGRRPALDAGRPTRSAAATPRSTRRSAWRPDDVIDAGQGLRPARPRRRRLPDRHEVGLHPAGQPASRSTSWSTPTSPSRAPARTSR